MCDGYDFDVETAYLEFLNGGAPVDENAEIGAWARNICEVRREEE